MISHECGYVGLKKSKMLVCVCFEVKMAISTVVKLRRVSRHTHLRMCVYSFRKSKYVKRLNMLYNLKAKGGMHTFEHYRHYV